jgi:hypothetical protein
MEVSVCCSIDCRSINYKQISRLFSQGCFVTNILLGGPADVQGNIQVGDQILEFNGNSLIDSTYEEVRMLQDQCGDIVQLVVQHNNIRLQINGGQALSSIEVSRHFETVPRLSSSLTRKRRNLPPLPPSLSSSFPKQSKRQLYQTVETLEVPNVKELKPILINRGRLLGRCHTNTSINIMMSFINTTDDEQIHRDSLKSIKVVRLPFERSNDLSSSFICVRNKRVIRNSMKKQQTRANKMSRSIRTLMT